MKPANPHEPELMPQKLSAESPLDDKEAMLINNNVQSLIQKLEMVENEIQDEETLLRQDSDYVRLLSIPNISMEERMEWLRYIFDGRVSDETMALICVLSERVGMSDFSTDIETFMQLLQHKKEVARGIIYSVKPLTEDEVNSFRTKLEQLFHKNVILVNRIDSTLIGGVCISLDGKLIDMSIRKKLEDLHISINDVLSEGEAG